jgi:excisionase family DNA binding protein
VTVETVPELLTVEEAGALLRMGRARAYEWASSGQMPGTLRLGRSIRVSRRILLAWIDEQTSGGATSSKVTPLGVDRAADHTPTAS